MVELPGQSANVLVLEGAARQSMGDWGGRARDPALSAAQNRLARIHVCGSLSRRSSTLLSR